QSIASTIGDSTNNVCYCIGPEGGLTDEERALASQHQWLMVGLGPRTLRIETAAIAAAASVIAVLGPGQQPD
ncbi:MAG: RsmE family RNA methyltransferase, partial [Pirellulaceae bacterium]